MIRIIKSKKSILLLVAFALILLLSPVHCYAKNTVNFIYSKDTKKQTSLANLDKAGAAIRKIFSTYASNFGSFDNLNINIVTYEDCIKKTLACDSLYWGDFDTNSNFKYIIYDNFVQGTANMNAHEILHGFNPGSWQNPNNHYDVKLKDNRTWNEMFTAYYSDRYFPGDPGCITMSHLSTFYFYDSPEIGLIRPNQEHVVFRVENDTSTSTIGLPSLDCAYDYVTATLPKIFEVLRLLGISDPESFVQKASYTGKLSTIDSLIKPYSSDFMYNIGSVLNPYWIKLFTGNKDFMQSKNELRKALAYIDSVKQKIIVAGISEVASADSNLGTIRLDIGEQNAMPGTDIAINSNINGLFPVGDYTYKAYIAMHPSESAPTASVSDSNTWVLYNTGATDNTFQVTAADASSPFAEYTLPAVTWKVTNTTEFGTRYIKLVVFDQNNSIICSDTGFININASILPISLTANGEKYFQFDKTTATTDLIKIVGTLTAESTTTTYAGELYISKEGYTDQTDKYAENASDFELVGKKTFERNDSPQTLDYDWTPKNNDSKTGLHEVVYKVYADGTFISKLIIWIKICKNGACSVVIPPAEGDKSTIELKGALAEAGIKVDFESYTSVVKFIKDTWFPIIIGMFAFFGIIYSGWMYIMSAGDQAKADKGKKGLLYSVIGVAIAVLAQVIIKVSESMIDKFSGATSVVGSNSIFTKVTDVIAIISGILAFIYLVYSGILYLTAAGNPDNSKKGLQGVINAAIGIVIIVTAWAIIGAVTGTLGSYFK